MKFLQVISPEVNLNTNVVIVPSTCNSFSTSDSSLR